MGGPKIDAERVEWSRRYTAAVRRFLRQGKSGSLQPAARLGRRAASLGLETLDVARIHEQALNTVTPPEGAPGNIGQERIARADTFFKETLVPIEATHRAAQAAGRRIDRLTGALRRRATESSASKAQLAQAIDRREAAEASADAYAVRREKLLAEAQRMQKRLRKQMRAILAYQEGERKQLGGELRDEIAQALLAIDLSLLALKTSGHVDTDKAEKSIANAEQILRELYRRERLSKDGSGCS